MERVLQQVKSSRELAEKPIESLLITKPKAVNQSSDRVTINPEIEVALLHNMNTDLEYQVKEMKRNNESLQELNDTLKRDIDLLRKEQGEILQKHEKALLTLTITDSHSDKKDKEEIEQLTALQKQLEEKQNEMMRMKKEMQYVVEEKEGIVRRGEGVEEKMRKLEALLDGKENEEREKMILAAENEELKRKVEQYEKETKERREELEKEKEKSQSFLEDIKVIQNKSNEMRKKQEYYEELEVQYETSKKEIMRWKELETIQRKEKEELERVIEEERVSKKCKRMEVMDEHEKLLEEKDRLLEEEKQERNRVTNELQEKLEVLNKVSNERNQLLVRESEIKRLEEKCSQFEKEMSSIHMLMQKQEGKSSEERIQLESRANYAEQSLEAYKKEIEGFMREKIEIEKKEKALEEENAAMKVSYETISKELEAANRRIKENEEVITKQETISQQRMEELLIRVKEMSVLNMKQQKMEEDRIALESAHTEEITKMQNQYEAVVEENNRLRRGFEERISREEDSIALVREGEMKVDHWRKGLETSYQQKKLLKEAMRSLIEENTMEKENAQRAKNQRVAMERLMMVREDTESMMRMKKRYEEYDENMGTYEWGRRLSRFIARNRMEWNHHSEDTPALPEDAALLVIQNTIDSLEWKEEEKKYLMNWIDFFSHGGQIENVQRFSSSIRIENVAFDIMDGFLTLMVPYMKTGVRSEYNVQAYVRQKPSVVCDMEIVVSDTKRLMASDEVEGKPYHTVHN